MRTWTFWLKWHCQPLPKSAILKPNPEALVEELAGCTCGLFVFAPDTAPHLSGLGGGLAHGTKRRGGRNKERAPPFGETQDNQKCAPEKGRRKATVSCATFARHLRDKLTGKSLLRLCSRTLNEHAYGVP